jgi:hypothetical protein
MPTSKGLEATHARAVSLHVWHCMHSGVAAARRRSTYLSGSPLPSQPHHLVAGWWLACMACQWVAWAGCLACPAVMI